ncbi:MAG: choice-of-anchor F family protein [Proteobacteria bacterium]|nr:choice-of-anchor F family protein [Pseudomonadota bacterium]MBU1737847.1 choice-of-anchor F family protein [Pseudomonadota bacterium]
MKTGRLLLATAAGVLAAAGASQAGIINGWDMDTVIVPPGPYTEYVTYYSTIYTDSSMTATNGAITWKETDVLAPGLKVVNGDDVDGTNCLMTTGYNPYDLSDKQCSDPLQSSKRFKVKNLIDGPIDVSFNVSDGPKSTYRSLQKLTDGTTGRWDGFTIDLGFTVNGQFVPSTAGDGLGFSDTAGNYWTTPVTTYQSQADTFSATYAQGLAGPPDAYHPEPGYFNPVERMGFGMIATEDTINSDGITTTYSDVFGPWLNSSACSIAVYYDDDSDINTDNRLMINCADASDITKAGTHTGDDTTGYTCNGVWVTYRSQVGLDANGAPYISDGIPKIVQLSDLAPVVYTSKDAAIASGDPNPYYMDQIEDLANLGLNFWITVDNNANWPTPTNFTIRYTPIPSDGSTPPPPAEETMCADGMDNDGDNLIDCSDPDCAGIGICGPEGKYETCSDGYDNDGDNLVDCADPGCAKNRSCR